MHDIRYEEGIEALHDRLRDPNQWTHLAWMAQYASLKEDLKRNPATDSAWDPASARDVGYNACMQDTFERHMANPWGKCDPSIDPDRKPTYIEPHDEYDDDPWT